MIEVIEQTDKLIDVLNDTDFVRNMIKLRKEILKKNIVINKEDKIVREYIFNQNEFDLHIYYLNNEIKKLINNNSCRRNNESN